MSGTALPTRLAGAAGALWGASLLVAAPRIWLTLSGGDPTRTDLVAVRALGARHLGQGLFQAVAPTTGQRVRVGVELLHASSMLAVAVPDTPRRRPALASATVALTVAVTNVVLMSTWQRWRRGSR